MDSKNNINKANIFFEELLELKRNNLISQSQFDELKSSYTNLLQVRQNEAIQQISSPVSNQVSNQHPHQESYTEANHAPQNTTYKEENYTIGTNLRSIAPDVKPIVKPIIQPHNIKAEKKVKTPDQNRERNITWSLILGVIMLLTAGLILSTTNWNYMNDILKVISIASVSVLFFSLSWLTEKVLKIKKTSFAFLILGSSFVPIIFVGIGFFELFGKWLSFYGEGKYVFGMIGSIVSCIIYSIYAKKHDSRLFTWLSLITLSSIVAFGLASLKLNIDAFFLGVIIYNALLLFGSHKYKNLIQLQWVIKAIPLFSQINLILSSIFTLVFFNNYLFYSFNLIIIAIIYISKMYMNHSKHYHFAFTIFVTYGLYQLASHTPFHHVKEVIIASIALIFIGLQYYQRINDNTKKIFHWTSTIISFLAFIYITVQSVFLSSGSNPITMFFAYLILVGTYIYLTHMTNTKLFAYLANIFILLSIYQLYKSIPFISEYLELFHFIFISGVLYFIYYKERSYKWFVPLKSSSLIINEIAYIVFLAHAFVNHKWLTTCILSLLLSAIFYFIFIKEKNIITQINYWVAPILLILSSISFYELFDFADYDLQLHLAFTSVAIVLFSFVMKKWNMSNTSTFYVPQFLFALILINLRFITNGTITVPLIMFLSIVMSYLLIKRTRIEQLWILFSILASLFYFSLLYPIVEINDESLIITIHLIVYSIVFLVIQKLIKEHRQKYFYWTYFGFSIASYLTAIIFKLTNFDEIPSLILVIPTLIYGYEALRGKTEVKIKLNLYVALIFLPLLSIIISKQYFPAFNDHLYLMMYVGLFIAGLWLYANNNWKRRLDWFIIPYLLLFNLIVFAVLEEELLIGNILLVVSGIVNIILVHIRKWNYVLLLPLLEMVTILFLISDLYSFSHIILTALASSIVLLLQFISIKSNKLIKFSQYFDSYLICSLFLIFVLEINLINQVLLLRLVPTLLLTIVLFLTIKRVTTKLAASLAKTFILISLFIIYYKVIFELYDEIWSHIRLELFILPFIIGIIYLKKKVWDNENVMMKIEWIILSISAVLIVFDGIISSTIADTIIMGVIGLLGLISGMMARIKSYFLLGCGIVLITLYSQTRPMWSSLPWWIYLLVGGIILITLASIYEWQKQNNRGIKDKWIKLKTSFKAWK